ncbi:hypothetical protein KC327_g63 [Hortaea werneckii]|nr:hypothetical protein KC327_g63 [Hortaea werneckii]
MKVFATCTTDQASDSIIVRYSQRGCTRLVDDAASTPMTQWLSVSFLYWFFGTRMVMRKSRVRISLGVISLDTRFLLLIRIVLLFFSRFFLLLLLFFFLAFWSFVTSFEHVVVAHAICLRHAVMWPPRDVFTYLYDHHPSQTHFLVQGITKVTHTFIRNLLINITIPLSLRLCKARGVSISKMSKHHKQKLQIPDISTHPLVISRDGKSASVWLLQAVFFGAILKLSTCATINSSCSLLLTSNLFATASAAHFAVLTRAARACASAVDSNAVAAGRVTLEKVFAVLVWCGKLLRCSGITRRECYGS